MYSRVGRRNPLYSTAIGKVLLAWQDEAEVRTIMADVEYKRQTEHTHTTIDELLADLAVVRQQGFSQDCEEQESGLRCLGVPVYDRFGHIIAGLSMSFPTIRFEEPRLLDYVRLLHRAAANISMQLGLPKYPFLND